VSDLIKRLDRPIVLVGLMGAGKSTVGRRLAKRLGLPFVDSDSEIEDAVGLPWGELFERYGEADYRDGERRVVARLVDGQIRVIATGGGVFVDARTRQLLKDQTITIWLDAPIDILAERTGRRDTRPLLKTENPKQTLEKLMHEFPDHAVGASASFGSLIIVCTASSLLGGIAPVPGGMGVVEASYISLLTLLGIPEDLAIATTLLYRLCTTYLPPIWGWGALVWLRRHDEL